MRPGMEVAGLSDLGCQRENNEDSYSYWEPASDAEFARKGRLAVVADGMGGHEGGLEASRIAVEVIQETYCRPVAFRSPSPADCGLSRSSPAYSEVCGRTYQTAGNGDDRHGGCRLWPTIFITRTSATAVCTG